MAITNINLESIKQSFNNRKSKKKIKLLPWKYPYTIEREHIQNALNVHRAIVDIYRNDIRDRLQVLINVRTDSIPEEIEQTMNIFNDNITREINNFAFASGIVGTKIATFNKRQIEKIIQNAFNIKLIFDEPWMQGNLDSFIIENTSLITKLSNETRGNIGEIVQRGYRNNDSWKDISKEINQKILPNNYKRSKLIGRDQVNKLNGQFTMQRQTDLGIDNYFWRTVNDEKVRPSHFVMNGLLCSWRHSDMIIDSSGDLAPRPVGATLSHPGYDIQCRCHAEMYFDDILNFQL